MALSFCWAGVGSPEILKFREGLDGGLSSSFSEFSKP